MIIVSSKKVSPMMGSSLSWISYDQQEPDILVKETDLVMDPELDFELDFDLDVSLDRQISHVSASVPGQFGTKESGHSALQAQSPRTPEACPEVPIISSKELAPSIGLLTPPTVDSPLLPTLGIASEIVAKSITPESQTPVKSSIQCVSHEVGVNIMNDGITQTSGPPIEQEVVGGDRTHAESPTPSLELGEIGELEADTFLAQLVNGVFTDVSSPNLHTKDPMVIQPPTAPRAHLLPDPRRQLGIMNTMLHNNGTSNQRKKKKKKNRKRNRGGANRSNGAANGGADVRGTTDNNINPKPRDSTASASRSGGERGNLDGKNSDAVSATGSNRTNASSSRNHGRGIDRWTSKQDDKRRRWYDHGIKDDCYRPVEMPVVSNAPRGLQLFSSRPSPEPLPPKPTTKKGVTDSKGNGNVANRERDKKVAINQNEARGKESVIKETREHDRAKADESRKRRADESDRKESDRTSKRLRSSDSDGGRDRDQDRHRDDEHRSQRRRDRSKDRDRSSPRRERGCCRCRCRQ